MSLEVVSSEKINSGDKMSPHFERYGEPVGAGVLPNFINLKAVC